MDDNSNWIVLTAMENCADDQKFCLLTLLIWIEPLNVIIWTKCNFKMPETVELDCLRVAVPDYSINAASCDLKEALYEPVTCR